MIPTIWTWLTSAQNWVGSFGIGNRLAQHVGYSLLVVAIAAVALLVAWIGHWRWGSALFGAALCFAAAERMILPPRVAGLLHVRSRALDVTMMLGTGIVIIVLSVWVPGQ